MVNIPQHLIDSEVQRQEVADAIRSWMSLKNTQWNNRSQRPALENILKILNFIGVQCDSHGVSKDSTRGRRNLAREFNR